jgi:hypothetical protein
MLLTARKNKREWLVRVLSIVIAIAMVVGLSQALYAVLYAVADPEENLPEMIAERSFPFTHFYMMGLNSSNGRYGVYNDNDVGITFGAIGTENKMALNISVARERLKEMGFLGYIQFLCQKSAYVFNDGALAFAGEGGFLSMEPNERSEIGKAMQAFFYGDMDRPSRAYVLLADGIWLAVLVLMCVSFFQKKGKDAEALFAMRLCLLGLALFLLLFEARPRYLVNHLPLIALLAVQGGMMLRNGLMKNTHPAHRIGS